MDEGLPSLPGGWPWRKLRFFSNQNSFLEYWLFQGQQPNLGFGYRGEDHQDSEHTPGDTARSVPSRVAQTPQLDAFVGTRRGRTCPVSTHHGSDARHQAGYRCVSAEQESKPTKEQE